MSATARSQGVLRALVRFFVNPRGSMRAVLDSRPSEGRILAFGMFAALIVFIRQTAPIFRAEEVSDAQLVVFIEHLVSALFFLPLGFYLAAVLATLIAKAFRGQGTWYDGRVAFFWALFLSSIVLVVVQLSFRILGGTVPMELLIVLWSTAIVFCPWALAQCFAEAFSFSRTWLVFAVTCSPMILLFIAYASEAMR